MIQKDMTAESIATEALRLLSDDQAREAMKAQLAEVAAKLASDVDPMEKAAECIERVIASEKGMLGVEKLGVKNLGIEKR